MKTTAPINCISPSFECHASNGCFARTHPRCLADGGRSVLVSAALGLILPTTAGWECWSWGDGDYWCRLL